MLQVDDHFWVQPAFPAVEPPGTVFKTQQLLKFGPSSSFEAALVLTLIGAGNILDGSGRRLVGSRLNFGISGSPKISANSEASVRKALQNVGLDVVSLDKYLQKSQKQQKYYRELLLEIVHALVRSKKGQHLAAFLHLYRFLERVSYVFPITYAISSEDYKGTYDAFKSFISGEKTGELKFFQKFQAASIEEALRKASMKFDFQGIPFGGEAGGYQVVKKFSSPALIVSEAVDLNVELESQGVIELAINLRNRFFHAGSGHTDNLSLVSISDPDAFFGRINGPVLNWLSILYFQTLISKAERFA